MNNNLTEIVFILDRSGSMAGLEADTIGGYNAFIEKQKREPGEAQLTTILFDTDYDVIHDAVPLDEVEPLTSEHYFARGCTALMDAIGRTINAVGARLAATPEDERPGHVVFVITTDGYENSSREFTRDQIKGMVEHQTNVYNWQFLFLGADIDASQEASSIGISLSASHAHGSAGYHAMYCAVDTAVNSVRSGGTVTGDWADALNAGVADNSARTAKTVSADTLAW